jgi:hypothetical protein
MNFRISSCSLVVLLFILGFNKVYCVNPVKELVIKTDTLQAKYSTDRISLQNEEYLPFFFNSENEFAEINVYTNGQYSFLKLLKSQDFEILDSIVLINQEYYRTKIRFNHLGKTGPSNLIIQLKNNNTKDTINQEYKLFPYTNTFVNFFPSADELYIGEEKIFELTSNHPDNIKINSNWLTSDGVNYRVSERNNQIWLHILPLSVGSKNIQINVQTISPFLDNNKKFQTNLPAIPYQFKVKNSRIAFLGIDKKEVIYDDDTRKNGIEITLDNNRNLQLHKTYRIENQEEPGGALMAEIFTKNFLANDKVLCIFRPYNLHKQTEGYLYIKDNDDAKFITNLNIIPKTTISSISILRKGQEWTPGNNVYPGETVDVKIEGESLLSGKFYWDEINDISSDSVICNDNVRFFRLQIPLQIKNKRITLYNNSKATSTSLNVKEYQTPRPFDYISISSGTGKKVVQSTNTTIIQRYTIPDVILTFDKNKIDSDQKLYGNQFLDIDIQIIGTSNQLIETQSLKNILVSPGETSPRSDFYKDKTKPTDEISVNNLFNNKTYNLEDFNKIQVTIKNSSDKYQEQGNEKKVVISLQHKVAFDFDVSFPTGLLIQDLGSSASGTTFGDNLDGISLALIAQFKFPDANKVGKLKPYRFGAGFLAINAFNFSSSASRDLAAVVLASVYPIKTRKMFNLPIHIGFGYKIQGKTPFIMLSPGLGITF